MGIFGSKTKINVFSTTLPLAGGSKDSLHDTLLYSIVQDIPFTDAIKYETLNGMAAKVASMYNYARDYYTLGLPQGRHGSQSLIPEAAVKARIEEDQAPPYGVYVEFCLMSILTADLAVLPILRKERNYNPTTNRITVFPPDFRKPYTGVVAVDQIVFSTDMTTFDITYKIFSLATQPEVYPSTTGWFPPFTYTETFNTIPNLVIGRTYVIAKYYDLDVNLVPINHEKYWYYDISTNKYPGLTALATSNEHDTFLPVVPIRYNNVSLTEGAAKNTELYATSKKLLKKVSIDIDQLGPKLNANPDISEIDHAYVIFGVNLRNADEAGIHYLVEFFDYLYGISTYTRLDFIKTLSERSDLTENSFKFLDVPNAVSDQSESFSYSSDLTVNAVNAVDSISMLEHGLDTQVNYTYISSTFKAGSIGKVGTATKELSSIPHNTATFSFSRVTGTEYSKVTLRLQVTTTHYKEVIITGLVHINNIYKGHSVYTYISDIINDPDENNFIIPIHYAVALQLPLLVRNKLFADSFMLTVNSYKKTKVKWYQTGWARALIIVAGIAITVWSLGTMGPWVAGAITALEAGLIAFVLYILPAVLLSAALYYGSQLLIKQIGGELAVILAIVTVIATFIYNPTGAVTIVGTQMPTAQLCLSASGALLSAVNTDLQRQLYDVSKETELLTRDMQTKQDDLNRALELLDTRSDFNPLTFTNVINYKSVLNETPTTFYNRTIHTGNIGTIVLDITHNYYDISLKLPSTKSYI